MDLKGLNFSKLLRPDFNQNLNGLDPMAFLQQLGMNDKESKSILSGDMSSLLKEKRDILDYNQLLKRFNKSVNKNLINYFFEKAKSKEGFTDDEQNVYGDAWNIWFDIVFKYCKNHIFQHSAKTNDQSLLVKKDENLFQMVQFDDIKQIVLVS